MTGDAAAPCIFCSIIAGDAESSTVYEDDVVVVFMALAPVAPGHLLVVPRDHSVGLEDLVPSTGAHVWTVGQRMAQALRRSALPCDGINVLLCDGEAAYQSVFHLHLHVIPRTHGDGWTLTEHQAPERERGLLDQDARAVMAALPAGRD